MTSPVVLGCVVAVVTALAGVAVVAAGRGSSHDRLRRRLGVVADPSRPAFARPLIAPESLRRAVRYSGLAAEADQLWRTALAVGGTAVLLVAFLAGPWAAVALLATAVAGLALAPRLLAGRDDALVERALPGALEAIARSLRAGGSLRTALAETAATVRPPLADDLARLVRATDRGLPLGEAIDDWVRERPLAGVRLAAAALALGIDAGSGLARTLDGVAATLYERASLEREVRLLSTQTRYSAVVLVLAPVGFLAVVAMLDPVAVEFLFGTVPGLACLATGLVLDGAAGWWMARITRAAS